MIDREKERLMLQAQLKALTAKFDPQSPLGDVKTAVANLVEALESIRGSNATRSDNDARVHMMHMALDSNLFDNGTPELRAELRMTLSEVDAVRALQQQLFEQLGNAIARANETRAHIALANATLVKLIGTVSKSVDAAVERDIAKAPTRDAVPRVLRLQIHMPGLAVREERFDQDAIKVGKLPSSHLKLEDDNVSRMHAVIERVQAEDKQGGIEWYVIDLGSAAGTIVNDRKVNKAKLQIGDRIIFGGVNITVLG